MSRDIVLLLIVALVLWCLHVLAGRISIAHRRMDILSLRVDRLDREEAARNRANRAVAAIEVSADREGDA